MDVGESWAYRARKIDPLVEVRVVRIGTARPARVLVRFVADEFEGGEEWVPPARLKVPWSEADEYLAGEARWARWPRLRRSVSARRTTPPVTSSTS